MTDSTNSKRKPTQKRRKQKRPELSKRMNLKSRQDYMDTFYVNGVKDINGKELMRALNEEEKDWLAQFYREWLNADLRDPVLYTSDEDKKKIYDENNARNRCLYNQSKKMGKLVRFNGESYDKKIMSDIGDPDMELMITEFSDLNEEETEKKKKP